MITLHCLKETQDIWNPADKTEKLVRVMLWSYNNMIRISVWGADLDRTCVSDGLEYNYQDHIIEATSMYITLLSWQYVNKQPLIDLRFYPA